MFVLQLSGERLCNSILELEKLGQGGEGVVYLWRSSAGARAVKIYHSPSAEKQRKIEAMLRNRPKDSEVVINNLPFTQLAWPTDIVLNDGQFLGFVMPYVDAHLSHTLDHYLDPLLLREMERIEPLSLPQKLEIARNIAAVVSLIHEKNIWFIDFKPQNVRVYNRYHTVCFIDCDGFAINDASGVSYPAQSFSSEYISPKALIECARPSQLGKEQDLFALAVVLFQLLNYGLHPFSGIALLDANVSTTDDKVKLGLYPYSTISHPHIRPNALSVHDCFANEIRELFDRAFGSDASPVDASEWVSVVDRILNQQKLERCSAHPNDVNHIKFVGQGCLACERESKVFIVRESQGTNKRKKNSASRMTPMDSINSATRGSTNPSSAKSSNWGVLVIVGIGVLVAFYIISQSSTEHSNTTDHVSSNSPGSTPSVAQSNDPVSNVVLSRNLQGLWSSNCGNSAAPITMFSDSYATNFRRQWSIGIQDSRLPIKRRLSITSLSVEGFSLIAYANDETSTYQITWNAPGGTLQLVRLVRIRAQDEAFVLNGRYLQFEGNPKTDILRKCP